MRKPRQYTNFKQHRIFLLNEPNAPRFSPSLAAEIGVDESIVLLQIEFWIVTEGQEVTPEQIAECQRLRGPLDPTILLAATQQKWLYLSIGEIRERFSRCWSKATVGRILDSLASQNLLYIADFNTDGDQTNWLALNFDGAALLKSITMEDKSPTPQEDTDTDKDDEPPSHFETAPSHFETVPSHFETVPSQNETVPLYKGRAGEKKEEGIRREEGLEEKRAPHLAAVAPVAPAAQPLPQPLPQIPSLDPDAIFDNTGAQLEWMRQVYNQWHRDPAFKAYQNETLGKLYECARPTDRYTILKSWLALQEMTPAPTVENCRLFRQKWDAQPNKRTGERRTAPYPNQVISNWTLFCQAPTVDPLQASRERARQNREQRLAEQRLAEQRLTQPTRTQYPIQ